jgi:hypothetical protein
MSSQTHSEVYFTKLLGILNSVELAVKIDHYIMCLWRRLIFTVIKNTPQTLFYRKHVFCKVMFIFFFIMGFAVAKLLLLLHGCYGPKFYILLSLCNSASSQSSYIRHIQLQICSTIWAYLLIEYQWN